MPSADGGAVNKSKKYRDVFLKTSCDAGVDAIATLMNASSELKALIANGIKPKVAISTAMSGVALLPTIPNAVCN